VELVKNVEETEHVVFRECLKFCKLEKDIELHNVADLPAFTGLGSSSTFTVSLLQALHAFKGEFISPLQLAHEAIHVERHLVHDNVGCQDQVLAACGGFNIIEFRAEDDVVVNKVTLPPQRLSELESCLILVFTGIKRRAADVVSKQLKRVDQNLGMLRTMRKMVDEGHNILTSNRPLREMGELLHKGWMAKRELDGCISTPEIDEMYQRGITAGAWGGKLLGAGGGGFLMFFAPAEVHPKIESLFREQQILHVKLNAPGSQIIFS
jgi:D-glycero-alpha-D-manno-heptose-7-phosphate kinase